MAAFISYSCSCTSGCCNCTSTSTNYGGTGVLVISGLQPIIVSLHMVGQPVEIGLNDPPRLNPRNLFGGDFLTWLFWTGWQIALPRAVDSLPPARPRRPTPLRKPRVRARGHHPGHSPRRAA